MQQQQKKLLIFQIFGIAGQSQAFTNCMRDYEHARNKHANCVTCTQKFVHSIFSSV